MIINKIIATILLCIIIPLVLLIILLIIIIDGFPVFFTQKRKGINDVDFNLIKFRSMKNNIQDIPSDKLTNVNQHLSILGPFLRKYSLDELPQLINIIKGEMNFIGPRPALYNQYDLIILRKEKGISTLKPGVTGWAQVNGRDNLSIPEKVILEEFYLNNRTLKLDITIIILTFKQLIMPKGVSH